MDWKTVLKDKELRTTVENFPGAEFRRGSGISGKDAQVRYLLLTKYFKKLYFDFEKDTSGKPLRSYTKCAQDNRDALLTRLQELVEIDAKKEASNDGVSQRATDEKDRNGKRKGRKKT